MVGDVQKPGSFPFQPQLTVEKAIGLAGGQIATNPAEDPVLARARLRGNSRRSKPTLRARRWPYARLTAELAGRTEILPEDVPATAREYVSGPLAESVREVEARIAKADTEGFAAQQDGPIEQIAAAEKGLELLDQLLEKVNGTIELAEGDLERAKSCASGD